MFRATIATRAASAAAAAAATATTPKPAETTTPAEDRQTSLHEFHKSIGGKMVPFCGWSMPVQYANAGVFKEHVACRTAVAAFDVSHMGQVRFYGADREAFLEYVSPADIKALPYNKGRLSCLMNSNAGLIDDIIVSRFDKHIGVVINAGRTKEDIAHFKQSLKDFNGDVQMVHDETLSLVALQGPKAAATLAELGVAGLEKLNFMEARPATIAGIQTFITRCGYTGEDGFEISAPHADIVKLCDVFQTSGKVQFAGLGARDSLRMEAGMCLYGHELSETTNVVEAGLQWLITKRRSAEGGYIGHDALVALKNDKTKTPTRRVGIVSKGACARENTKVLDTAGNVVGTVTSGCPSPSMGCNVAQAYLNMPFNKVGTKVVLDVRGRKVEGEVAKMSFIDTHYYTAPQ